jgi:hypothetical protein
MVELPTHHRFIDITGKRFGKLTVAEYMGIRNTNVIWRCVCDCGGETITEWGNLRSDETTSCGY